MMSLINRNCVAFEWPRMTEAICICRWSRLAHVRMPLCYRHSGFTSIQRQHFRSCCARIGIAWHLSWSLSVLLLGQGKYRHCSAELSPYTIVVHL